MPEAIDVSARYRAITAQSWSGMLMVLLTMLVADIDRLAIQGSSYDEQRARTVIQVMAALFDLAVTMFAADPDTELSALYAELLSVTRSALA